MSGQIESLDLNIRTQLICGAEPISTDPQAGSSPNGITNGESGVTGDHLSSKRKSLDSSLANLRVLELDGVSSVDQLNEELKRIDFSSDHQNYIDYLKALTDPQSSLPTLLLSQQSDNELDVLIFLKSMTLSVGTSQFTSFFKTLLLINKFPSGTNLMGWHYFDQLIEKITTTYFQNVSTYSEFEAIFLRIAGVTTLSVFGGLISYIMAFKVFEQNSSIKTDLMSSLQKHSVESVSKLSFPKATDLNIDVKLIVEGLLYFVEKHSVKFNLESVIENALPKSYQSIPVMRLWCINSILKSNQEKVLATFKVYLQYTHEEKLQNGNKYVDIVSVIDLNLQVLDYLLNTKLNRNLFEQVLKWFESLSRLINVELLELLEETKLSPILTQKLSAIWYKLGLISKSLCQSYTITADTLYQRLERASLYFANSTSLISKTTEVVNPDLLAAQYFEYSLSLIRLGKLKEATKSIKLAIKLSPNELKYLNLITLLYSVGGKYEKPLSIANDILANTNEYLANTPMDQLTSEKKWDILQMHMTFIALREADEDQFEALSCLPSFFELVHTLFGYKSSFTSSNTEENEIKTSDKLSHRPSIVDPSQYSSTSEKEKEPRKNILNKIKPKKQHKTDAESTSTPVTELSLIDTNMLVEVWLWTSKLFQRCSMLSDAEGCVREAEAIGGSSYKTHARLGHLNLGVNDQLSLQELEISLDMKEDGNAEAILGFACLVLQLYEGTTDAIFISEKDKVSSIARCKNYLESLTYTFKYCNSSETYYCLSQIYEQIGDDIRLEKSLFKCVELEESRPVRNFDDIFAYPA